MPAPLRTSFCPATSAWPSYFTPATSIGCGTATGGAAAAAVAGAAVVPEAAGVTEPEALDPAAVWPWADTDNRDETARTEAAIRVSLMSLSFLLEDRPAPHITSPRRTGSAREYAGSASPKTSGVFPCYTGCHYVHHAQAHQGVERPGSLALATPARLHLKPPAACRPASTFSGSTDPGPWVTVITSAPSSTGQVQQAT